MEFYVDVSAIFGGGPEGEAPVMSRAPPSGRETERGTSLFQEPSVRSERVNTPPYEQHRSFLTNLGLLLNRQAFGIAASL